MEVDHSGEPKMEYVRNKVRTTSESYYYFLFPTMDLIFLIL
jgi:hypothetical protein